jgi:hypothetical protein
MKHKFQPGDKVFIRGWDSTAQGTIVSKSDKGLLPHYEVRDSRKKCWLVSQIRMSTKPIVIKNAS